MGAGDQPGHAEEPADPLAPPAGFAGINNTALSWDANPETDLAGYEVVMRETSAADWTSAIGVGNVTSVTLDIAKDNVQFGLRAIDRPATAARPPSRRWRPSPHRPAAARRGAAPARHWPGGTVRRMPPVWIGLTLAFASALVTNTAYSLEHDAAARLPPLSPRRPFRSVQVLLRDRRWLIAFGAESAGWLMYVAALRLAPLALVQAVAASGVAVLAFATARGHPSRLARREQVAVVLAIAGLVLLALSLVDTSESDQHPRGDRHHHLARGVRWRRGAAHRHTDALRPRRLARAGGRPAVRRRRHLRQARRLRRVVAARAGHAHRRLRRRDERPAVGLPAGDALTAAGTATMVTNAVPIAAGFVLFGESLPHGARAVLQVAAFACLVAGAVALGHQQPPPAAKPAPPAETAPEALRALYRGTGRE